MLRMPNKKILMIVNPFPPLSSVGASIRTVKFLQYINLENFSIFILTQEPGKTFFPVPISSNSIEKLIPEKIIVIRKSAPFSLPKNFSTSKGNVSHSSVSKKKSMDGNDTPQKRNVFRWLRNLFLIPDEDILWVIKNFFFALRLSKKEKIDIVYSSGPPFSNFVFGYLIAKLSGSKLILDMKDDWVEASKRLGKNSFILWIEKYLEKIISSFSSKIMIPTEEGIDILLKRNSKMQTKAIYLPNGVDLSEINSNCCELEIENFNIVCAVGSIERKYRDIQPMIEAIAINSKTDIQFGKKCKLKFLGTDVRNEYSELIEKYNLKDKFEIFLGLTRKDYIRHLERASILYLPQMDNAPSSIPGTLYEYWAINNAPILLIGGEGATKTFLLKHNLGQCFYKDQIKDIADYILQMFNAWNNKKPIRINPYTSVKMFDRKNLAIQFEKILWGIN
jgi:glycosyltransferase involved in cell wall biosynthesis